MLHSLVSSALAFQVGMQPLAAARAPAASMGVNDGSIASRMIGNDFCYNNQVPLSCTGIEGFAGRRHEIVGEKVWQTVEKNTKPIGNDLCYDQGNRPEPFSTSGIDGFASSKHEVIGPGKPTDGASGKVVALEQNAVYYGTYYESTISKEIGCSF